MLAGAVFRLTSHPSSWHMCGCAPRYEPQTDWVRRPRPRMPGQMAELRAQLGDRELLAGAV